MISNNIISNQRPLLFVCSITHFGGAVKSTLALMGELKKSHPVFVLELHGNNREFLTALANHEIPHEVVRKPGFGANHREPN